MENVMVLREKVMVNNVDVKKFVLSRYPNLDIAQVWNNWNCDTFKVWYNDVSKYTGKKRVYVLTVRLMADGSLVIGKYVNNKVENIVSKF